MLFFSFTRANESPPTFGRIFNLHSYISVLVDVWRLCAASLFSELPCSYPSRPKPQI
ncbi:hypothetical protein GYM29_005111, partial [Escherichia coli]|nr:hypothetical protein [Escherichia coli]